jgi:UDP-N-acetylmuramate: L-alanyl-gamma-D-glutamyl-meso-diaminopimelate ligase
MPDSLGSERGRGENSGLLQVVLFEGDISMHVHIMGICGTFMGGIAILARQLGHEVTGSDQNVYPPMSTQLEEHGIALMSGYTAENVARRPDLIVVGNAISRGNPEMEAVLDAGIPYVSGPEWLHDEVLRHRWVLAVAGTHGKTTTTSMLTFILEHAGLKPGFLVGGIPLDFGISARLGEGDCFVVEADEYDTAFFDKRSKFVHYHPRTCILNNLEYDHADIFPDLASIQRQFHHLVRTIPGRGLIVAPDWEPALDEVLQMGCWTPVEHTAQEGQGSAATWAYHLLSKDGSRFEILHDGQPAGIVEWALTGLHNVYNGLAAVAAAHHAGVFPERSAEALSKFSNVKRRMEIRAEVKGITIYDDFAHHPTAIRTTVEGLRAKVGRQRIMAVLEPRSNTMRMGVHAGSLGDALAQADHVLLLQPSMIEWDLSSATAGHPNAAVFSSVAEIVERIAQSAQAGDHVLIMSNGGFEGIHQRVEFALKEKS